MIESMTGFASAEGRDDAGARWRWDAKSVNGRGLDLRIRAPGGWEAQEAGWRAAIGARFKRGSISLSLTVEEAESAASATLNETALAAAVAAAAQTANRLRARDMAVAPIAPEGLLALRGVFDAQTNGRPELPQARIDGVAETLEAALAALGSARAEEGARVAETLDAQISEIDRLTTAAAERAEARLDDQKRRLRERTAALLEASDGEVEEPRLAQELALIAVKIDVSEEIERLRGHVAAARKLLSDGGAVGRKLDFLTQEFNREANTLCSKAQDAELTETGLALKVVIDQLREQSANVA